MNVPAKYRVLLVFSVAGLAAGVVFNLTFGAAPWEFGGLVGGLLSGILLAVGS